MADASVSILFDGESERIARIISEISIEKRVVRYALDKDFLSLFGMYESKYIDWEKRGRLPKKIIWLRNFNAFSEAGSKQDKLIR